MACELNVDDMADESLSPPRVAGSGRLRHQSRSPHPYHRRGPNLSDSSDSGQDRGQDGGMKEDTNFTTGDIHTHGDDKTPSEHILQHPQTSSPKTSSDSGTDADDESGGFLKILPAPSTGARKGLRGIRPDESVRPLPTPSTLDVDLRKLLVQDSRNAICKPRPQDEVTVETKRVRDKNTRKKLAEILRRISETGLLGCVGYAVYCGEGVAPALRNWRSELLCHSIVSMTLYALHPLRLLIRWANSPKPTRKPLFRIPVTFDPAPLLYPLLLPLFVAVALIPASSVFTLPNLMLSLASLPPRLIPFQSLSPGLNITHWFLATSPLLVSQSLISKLNPSKPLALKAGNSPNLEPEILALLFPLHQSLLPSLEFLTTTSLLPAELQLLDIALINLLLFARSPPAEILKAVLWVGGLIVFVLCRQVLSWEVALARVPSWRFRRPSGSGKFSFGFLRSLRRKSLQRQNSFGIRPVDSSDSESEGGSPTWKPELFSKALKLDTGPLSLHSADQHIVPASAIEDRTHFDPSELNGTPYPEPHLNINSARRHTFSTLEETFNPPRRSRTTPSGRPKRRLSSKTKSLLNLTAFDALVRRWLYAIYTYAVVAIIILLPVRKYVTDRALGGAEPFGWALGYLFGNLRSFRLWVVKSSLEGWIPLPAREDVHSQASCHLGWVEHLRKDTLGEANTRLLICAYCVGVLGVGMVTVLRLSAIVEVDTRRKVFHGMMVAMFLPTIFVDPTFAALALSLVLVIFFVLDLFRASQLPPVSKPLTYFLAPYVDGRDHRGPVIVSHIFLLVGCAIPLWLSLAALKPTGQSPWAGWDVTLRDVSMVSGVICVGMGDAAASLIGRRYGRRKWFFSGGKSLEGSFAFALAVTLGLMASRIWLDVGRWPGANGDSLITTTWKAGVAATAASLTEAVLTGGNDNVIVPLVLWLMVKGLGI